MGFRHRSKKGNSPTLLLDNVVRHPKRRFAFKNAETGEEKVITQSLTHHGRVSAQYRHPTVTRAGRTGSHPIQTKPRRRAAAKAARASRKANRG